MDSSTPVWLRPQFRDAKFGVPAGGAGAGSFIERTYYPSRVGYYENVHEARHNATVDPQDCTVNPYAMVVSLDVDMQSSINV